MKLFISPHSDDAALFGSFTLQREKPVVLTVTDSFIQSNRGEEITDKQRRGEDIAAMQILGCSLVFGRLRDDVLDEWGIRDLLRKFWNFERIYIPAIQGGNAQHDLIGKVALELFPNATQYATYAAGQWGTEGTRRVVATGNMREVKEKALLCYKSQINLKATKPHFDYAKGADEWYV